MKKLRKIIRNCPLAVCILCSWAILAAAEYIPSFAKQASEEQAENPDDGQQDDALDDLETYDPLSGVMAANRPPELTVEELVGIPAADDADEMKTDDAPDEDRIRTDGAQQAGGAEPGAEKPGNAQPAGESEDAQPAGTEQEPQKIKPEYISYKKKQTDSPWYTDPGKIPLTTEYDYATVDDDYFDDAVFIGDSRIVGMNDYSGLTNATFFAKTGLTVYDLLDDEFIKDPDSGKKVSVSYMLQRHSYGKIYLMVGINELGTGGTERFKEAYRDVLKKFRRWQPDAVIYVQSIMGVSPAKDKSDAVFNNTNIRDKNYAISKLTDGIHIFYLNIQKLYEDKNHNLAQELTFDDVHLYAQHYDKWVKYLKEHAVKL